MNTTNSSLLFLLALSHNQTKTTSEDKESICTISSKIKISIPSGECSIAMTALIENYRIKECIFEVNAESDNVQNECLSSTLFLKNQAEGKTIQSILNFPEELFVHNRAHPTPLLDYDSELHKVIALRALKSGISTFLMPAE